MTEEPTENLWVRIKERAGTGDIIVGVCYRLTKQIGTASHSQALVLMVVFDHLDICWKDNTA